MGGSLASCTAHPTVGLQYAFLANFCNSLLSVYLWDQMASVGLKCSPQNPTLVYAVGAFAQPYLFSWHQGSIASRDASLLCSLLTCSGSPSSPAWPSSPFQGKPVVWAASSFPCCPGTSLAPPYSSRPSLHSQSLSQAPHLPVSHLHTSSGWLELPSLSVTRCFWTKCLSDDACLHQPNTQGSDLIFFPVTQTQN